MPRRHRAARERSVSVGPPERPLGTLDQAKSPRSCARPPFGLAHRARTEHVRKERSPVRGIQLPQGPFVRVDSSIYPGYEVPTDYDPTLMKLSVWGKDRPPRPNEVVKVLGVEFAGKKFEEKLEDLRKEVEKKKSPGFIVCMLYGFTQGLQLSILTTYVALAQVCWMKSHGSTISVGVSTY